MRFPPNLKYFLILIAAILVIVLATIYLPRVIPNIGEIMIGLVTAGVFIMFIFIFIKPFITFLYARADGIFEVYMDKNEQGIHVFSYHLNAGGDNSDGTRDVQHYFILISNGKFLFNKLFSHDMTPASGRSGWGDFYSFEENVLGTAYLEKSLNTFSKKLKMNLGLGRRINAYGNEDYEIRLNNDVITIKKYNNAADEGYSIRSEQSVSGKLNWKKKI